MALPPLACDVAPNLVEEIAPVAEVLFTVLVAPAYAFLLLTWEGVATDAAVGIVVTAVTQEAVKDVVILGAVRWAAVAVAALVVLVVGGILYALTSRG